MGKKIDISVIIPIYNASETLEACLDSVIAELSSNLYAWELILVDDKSTDTSLEILKNYISHSVYKSKIILIPCTCNKGVSSARNRGIRKASGEFLAFNDADDRWLPGKIQLQMDYMKVHPETDLLGCLFGEDNFKKNSLTKLEYVTKIGIRAQVLKNYFTPPTVIARRKFICSTNLFNESLHCAEDLYFFSELVVKGDCVLMQEVVAEPLLVKKRWGEKGLSAHILKHEVGELLSIRHLYLNGSISFGVFLFATSFSLLKFIRRFFVVLVRRCFPFRKKTTREARTK